MDDIKEINKMLREILRGQKAMRKEVLESLDKLSNRIDKMFNKLNYEFDSLNRKLDISLDKLAVRIGKLEQKAVTV